MHTIKDVNFKSKRKEQNSASEDLLIISRCRHVLKIIKI